MTNLPDIVTMAFVGYACLAIAYFARFFERLIPLIFTLPIIFFFGFVLLLMKAAPDALWYVLLFSGLSFLAISIQLWVKSIFFIYFVIVGEILILLLTKVETAWFFIGVSYLCFRTIEAFLQVSKLADNKPKGLVLLAIFGHIFNPLTLISGPINRLENTFTIIERKIYKKTDLVTGIYRVSLGLFRVYFLAMIFSQFGFADLVVLGKPTPILAIVAAFFQFLFVYYTFAGYCDMVIGIGKAAGYPIDENFNNPLLATSIGDFWGRFHITLTSFLKDYFVNPLVRISAAKFGASAINRVFLPISLVNFLIIGMWHGWAIKFLYLGLAHGGGFAIFWLYHQNFGKKTSKFVKQHFLYKTMSVILTIGWISFATSFIFVEPTFWINALGL